MTEHSVEEFIPGLTHRDRGVRVSAAHAVGELKIEKAVPGLIEALRDSDDSTRSDAISSLEKLRDPRAMDGLIGALGDPVWGVRASSAEALGTLGDPCAVDGLISALGDSDDATRTNAAEALSELEVARAVPALVDTLIDSSDEVRAATPRALGQLGDERAVPALMGALGDSDNSVREASAGALGTIGNSRSAPLLIGSLKDPDTGVRRAGVASLLKLDLGEHLKAAVTGLIEVMGDRGFTEEVDSLRAEATGALGELGDRRAVPVLIDALGQRYKDELFRAATRALSDIGDWEAGSRTGPRPRGAPRQKQRVRGGGVGQAGRPPRGPGPDRHTRQVRIRLFQVHTPGDRFDRRGAGTHERGEGNSAPARPAPPEGLFGCCLHRTGAETAWRYAGRAGVDRTARIGGVRS